ncbi:hypothetical protein [Yeosuana marina]|uniref:hypothetical protein n=1 Tax=Yeosuana marina TaxID=1565536 RepID=UPI001422A3BA|nr:hypothetical protein [Yeosuana marina]
MITLKYFDLFLIAILFLGCTSNSEDKEESVDCFNKASMESFEIEPGQCVVITENPDMKLVLVGFENHFKSINKIYKTTVTVRLEEPNFTWETLHEIEDNPDTDIIKFSGEIRTGINNDSYTIYIDNIDYTETETEFIFHKATIRVEYSIN